MMQEVRDELDRIEKFLMRHDQAAADLGAILSALRGPDDSPKDGERKTNGAMAVRSAAFPLLARGGLHRELQMGERHWSMGCADDLRRPESFEHYETHMRMAYDAIHNNR